MEISTRPAIVPFSRQAVWYIIFLRPALLIVYELLPPVSRSLWMIAFDLSLWQPIRFLPTRSP